MAILKLRDEGKLGLDDPAERYVPELKGLRYPTTDSPRITIRHLLTHSEGFPEDNPWGDQQLSESEAGLSRMLRDGIPFSNAPGIAYEYSNYGFAILGRVVSQVSGRPYRRVRLAEHPSAARHDVDDAAPVEGGGQPAGSRVSLGRRALEGRAGAPARVIRRDGRDADVDPRLEPLRLRTPRGVAAAGRAGARPDPPGFAPRDAAALAPRGRARRARQVDERNAPDVQRLRVWPPRDADVPVRRDGRARRRAARVRIAHALAPRLRGRHHRVRQRHLHRLESRGRGGDRSAWTGLAVCSLARSAPRLRSSPRATPSRSWSWDGTTSWPTGLPPRTCSWTVRKIGAARSSTICGRRSAPVLRPTNSTSSKTRCADNGR